MFMASSTVTFSGSKSYVWYFAFSVSPVYQQLMKVTMSRRLTLFSCCVQCKEVFSRGAALSSKVEVHLARMLQRHL